MSDWKDWDYLFDDVKGKIDGPINKINHHLPNINKNPKKNKGKYIYNYKDDFLLCIFILALISAIASFSYLIYNLS